VKKCASTAVVRTATAVLALAPPALLCQTGWFTTGDLISGPAPGMGASAADDRLYHPVGVHRRLAAVGTPHDRRRRSRPPVPRRPPAVTPHSASPWPLASTCGDAARHHRRHHRRFSHHCARPPRPDRRPRHRSKPARTIDVTAGDTLWDLAAPHLDDMTRWRRGEAGPRSFRLPRTDRQGHHRHPPPLTFRRRRRRTIAEDGRAAPPDRHRPTPRGRPAAAAGRARPVPY